MIVVTFWLFIRFISLLDYLGFDLVVLVNSTGGLFCFYRFSDVVVIRFSTKDHLVGILFAGLIGVCWWVCSC